MMGRGWSGGKEALSCSNLSQMVSAWAMQTNVTLAGLTGAGGAGEAALPSGIISSPLLPHWPQPAVDHKLHQTSRRMWSQDFHLLWHLGKQRVDKPHPGQKDTLLK